MKSENYRLIKDMEAWELKSEIEDLKRERDEYKEKYLKEKGPKWVDD